MHVVVVQPRPDLIGDLEGMGGKQKKVRLGI